MIKQGRSYLFNAEWHLCILENKVKSTGLSLAMEDFSFFKSNPFQMAFFTL